MKKALKWIVLAFIGIATGVIILFALFDWNWVKDFVEQEVSKRTGRPLHIGSIDGELSLTPSVRLKNIRLENAEWASRRYMVEIPGMEFQFKLLELLRFQLVVLNMTVYSPTLAFEISPQGESNWDVLMPLARLKIGIETLQPVSIQEGRLYYKSPASEVLISPFQAAAKLLKRQDRWHFQEFSLRAAQSDLTGVIQLAVDQTPARIQADLRSQRLDLNALIGIEPRKNKLLPEVDFAPQLLRAFNGDVRIKAGLVQAAGLAVEDVAADLRFDGGRVRARPVEMKVKGGVVRSDLLIDASRAIPRFYVNTDIIRLDLSKLIEALDYPPLAAGQANGRVQLTGTGNALSKFLATADGFAVFSLRAGRMDKLLAELAGLDLGGAIVAALTGDGSAEIRCTVGDFDVQDGVMRVNLLVVDLEETKIVGGGTVDLSSETLNLALQPRAKDFSLLAGQTTVHIGGSFTDISLKPEVGAALFSFLTPIEFGLAEDTDCDGLIDWANERHRD